MFIKQVSALAIAIACCGLAFAADQDKDASVKGKKKPPQTSSSAAPGADVGKSNIAGPDTSLADVPLKDRGIVAPDDFAAKDRKIVRQPEKTGSPTVLTDSKKPILAAPAAGAGGSVATAAGK